MITPEMRFADQTTGVPRLYEQGMTSAQGLGGSTSSLSRRELQVLALVAEGLTNKEIGQQLFVSTNTVNKHVAFVLAKLGARNRARAAVMYQTS